MLEFLPSRSTKRASKVIIDDITVAVDLDWTVNVRSDLRATGPDVTGPILSSTIRN